MVRAGRTRARRIAVLGALLAATTAAMLAAPALASAAQIYVVSNKFSATEGQSFSGTVASFVQTPSFDTVSEYAATINWGDGTTTPGTVVASPSGAWTVGGTHTYVEEGPYTVLVAVTDNGPPSQPSGESSAVVTVADAPLSEPATSVTLTGTAGVPVAGVLETFTDADPGGIPSDYTATVDWGDGTQGAAGIAVNPAGGFNVIGEHTYTHAGTFTVFPAVSDVGGAKQGARAEITVAPRTSGLRLACSPSTFTVSEAATCTVTVSDTTTIGTAETPTGTVAVGSATAGIGFGNDAGCVLAPTSAAGVASCRVTLTANVFSRRGARITAAYPGDPAHAGASSSESFGEQPAGCTVVPKSRRLAPGTGNLRITVRCDMTASVDISATADVSGARLTFRHPHAVIVAGIPSVITVGAPKKILKALVEAAAHHHRISVRVVLVVTPKLKPITVTQTLRGLAGP